MLKFIHAADFHLDSPFRALSPQLAAARRRESRELVERLATYALREEVGLVLLAGDLFDSDSIYRETAESLARALGSIPAPVLIAPGNHDWYGPGSPYAAISWPENVCIFKSTQMEPVELPGGICVHGAAFAAPEQRDSLLSGFRAPEDGRLHLGLLHGDVGSAEGRYNSLSEAEIAASGLHYLALGHVHACSGAQKAGGTVWAYPGCPEGRGFDELGEKGFYRGILENDGAVTLDFIPFARRRYEILSVDVTEQEPGAAVEAALPEETAPHLYRILLTGETDEKGVNLPALEAALESRFYSLELRDSTRMRQDVWAAAEEDSLRGLFLQRLRQRWETAADETERELVTKAARFGLAALDNRDLG